MIKNTNKSTFAGRQIRGSWLVATVLTAMAAVAPIRPASAHCFRPADINTDGIVNVADLVLLLGDYTGEIPVRARGARSDLNHDGFVNSIDLAILLADMG